MDPNVVEDDKQIAVSGTLTIRIDFLERQFNCLNQHRQDRYVAACMLVVDLDYVDLLAIYHFCDGA